MARENRSWGYTRIQSALANLQDNWGRISTFDIHSSFKAFSACSTQRCRLLSRSRRFSNPTIRRTVCDLLEGGERAFLERDRRYRLQWQHILGEAEQPTPAGQAERARVGLQPSLAQPEEPSAVADRTLHGRNFEVCGTLPALCSRTLFLR